MIDAWIRLLTSENGNDSVSRNSFCLKKACMLGAVVPAIFDLAPV